MPNQEEKRLLAELRALPDYQGWTFDYVYPGYFSYYRGPYFVFFTPDWEDEETLSIQVQDDKGHTYTLYSEQLSLPRAGRTGRRLFDLVRPTLDKISKVSRQHATKKLPITRAPRAQKKTRVQLDREIAEALTQPRVQSPHRSPSTSKKRA
jgi:hypothetical protein